MVVLSGQSVWSPLACLLKRHNGSRSFTDSLYTLKKEIRENLITLLEFYYIMGSRKFNLQRIIQKCEMKKTAGLGHSSVVECLPDMHEGLDSLPGTQHPGHGGTQL